MLIRSCKFNRVTYALFLSLLCLGLVAILVMAVFTGLQSVLQDVHIRQPVVNRVSALWEWKQGREEAAPQNRSLLTRLMTAVQVTSITTSSSSSSTTPPHRVTTRSLTDRRGPSSVFPHTVLQKSSSAVPASPLSRRPVLAVRPSPVPVLFPSPANKSVLAVTVNLPGMLGNHMFQYASLLGIAHRNGRRPVCNPNSGLHKHFHVTHVRDSHDHFSTTVSEDNFATYDPRFERLPKENVIIGSYLQSWKYFEAIRDTIRLEFSFQQSVKERAEGMRKKYMAQTGRNVTTVGVHVRRGDMVLASSQNRGYYTAPASYLARAMDYMRHKHGDVLFVVVSDDPGWCRGNLPDKSDYVIADPAPGPVHLALLASCRHVVMTVGTFGWWGGYLAGGDVVYFWDPKVCVHNPPLPVEIRHPEDFFLPSWVPLPG